MTHNDRLRIAVFIDFDNIEIGVKSTLGASFDAGLVLEALKERGEVVSKTAYSDWQRAGGYSRMLTQHAIKMVQRNLTPGGDKNGADINLALDALEMAFTHPHINAFVIVGGDSDFISLVEKLKQYDKKVFIVGGRQFTSGILQRNCHEFIAYENLAGASVRRPAGRDVRVERSPIEQARPLVARALKVLLEREVSPQLGLLKSTLLQLDSTFSERNYGAGSFRDFVEKLEKLGVVKLQQSKGGWLVEAVDGADLGEAQPAEAVEPQPASDLPLRPVQEPQPRGPAASEAAPPQTGTTADGLREFKRILSSAQIRRWPMYLRNVKQMIRQVTPSFDERAYGFANLVDLLRAAQREGAIRVERDRQGVIRVFQGTQPLPSGLPAEPAAMLDAGEGQGEPGERGEHPEEDQTLDEGSEEIAAAAAAMGVPIIKPAGEAHAHQAASSEAGPDDGGGDEASFDEVNGNRWLPGEERVARPAESVVASPGRRRPPRRPRTPHVPERAPERAPVSARRRRPRKQS